MHPLLTAKTYEILKNLESATTVDALNLHLEAAFLILGISTYSYSHYSYHPRAKQKLKYEYSTADFSAWHQHYLSEQYEEIDSTLHTAYLTTEPSIWMLDEQLAHAKSPREKQMRLDSIQYGIMGGISIPIHGANNDFAHLIVVQMKNTDPFLHHAAQLIPILILLGHYYFHAISRVLSQKHTHGIASLLTERELACLHLVSKRMSVNEIAKTLNITPRTVHFHIQNVNKKLGVANKFEAINKAIEIGMIVL